MFDYFYGAQAEQFSFYRLPKVLFTKEQFKQLSAEAKILYGIMLDKLDLSVKNKWGDEKGRVYIIYTIKQIMADMNCADQKATKLLDELEKKCGLIERKRQGLGKPNLIFVKNFITGVEGSMMAQIGGLPTGKRGQEIRKPELRDRQGQAVHPSDRAV